MRPSSFHPARDQPWSVGIPGARSSSEVQFQPVTNDERGAAMVGCLVDALAQIAGNWLAYRPRPSSEQQPPSANPCGGRG